MEANGSVRDLIYGNIPADSVRSEENQENLSVYRPAVETYLPNRIRMSHNANKLLCTVIDGKVIWASVLEISEYEMNIDMARKVHKIRNRRYNCRNF
jgi:hypothetical protein